MTDPERALAATLLWMTVGSAAAIPGLVVPQPDDPLATFTIHLALLAVFAVALTFRLAPLADEPWFAGLGVGHRARRALTWVGIVVMVMGATALVAIATSAALRYAPSLQFLQMLSALGLAWATSAIALGARRRLGAGSAVGAAALLGAVSVWVIWRYLGTVGFDVEGGWLLRASDLKRLVLPHALVGAVVTTAVFSAGVGREA